MMVNITGSSRTFRAFRLSTAARIIGIVVLFVLTVFPLYWLINISLLPDTEVYKEKPHYVPPLRLLTMESYRTIFVKHSVGKYILNSFVICFFATLITLAFSMSMSYYLAKYRFRMKRFFFYFIIWSLTLPWVVYVLPVFRIVNALRLLDTHILMILLHGIAGIPMFTWFSLPYMQDFPDEMIDAARLDGAKEVAILWRIVGPALSNMVIALFLIRFIFAYNDLLYALIFTYHRAKMITPSILDFPSPYSIPFALMSAGGVISVLPIIIIVIVFQRYIVSGLTGRTIK